MLRKLIVCLGLVVLPVPVSAADTITVDYCEYGTLGDARDLTEEDKRQKRGPRGQRECKAELKKICDGLLDCIFKVNNRTMGGDPATGHRKRVALDYRCGSISKERMEAGEDKQVELSC